MLGDYPNSDIQAQDSDDSDGKNGGRQNSRDNHHPRRRRDADSPTSRSSSSGSSGNSRPRGGDDRGKGVVRRTFEIGENSRRRRDVVGMHSDVIMEDYAQVASKSEKKQFP